MPFGPVARVRSAARSRRLCSGASGMLVMASTNLSAPTCRKGDTRHEMVRVRMIRQWGWLEDPCMELVRRLRKPF
jgi:hypothetical protein